MTDLAKLDFTTAYTLVFSSCAAGLLFGLYNWYKVMSLKLNFNKTEGDVEAPLMKISEESRMLMKEISEKIQKVITHYKIREPRHSSWLSTYT